VRGEDVKIVVAKVWRRQPCQGERRVGGRSVAERIDKLPSPRGQQGCLLLRPGENSVWDLRRWWEVRGSEKERA